MWFTFAKHNFKRTPTLLIAHFGYRNSYFTSLLISPLRLPWGFLPHSAINLQVDIPTMRDLERNVWLTTERQTESKPPSCLGHQSISHLIWIWKYEPEPTTNAMWVYLAYIRHSLFIVCFSSRQPSFLISGNNVGRVFLWATVSATWKAIFRPFLQ